MTNINFNIYVKPQEKKIAIMLCEQGLSVKEISYSSQYCTRHVQRYIHDLKVDFNADSNAQLGFLWCIYRFNLNTLGA